MISLQTIYETKEGFPLSYQLKNSTENENLPEDALSKGSSRHLELSMVLMLECKSHELYLFLPVMHPLPTTPGLISIQIKF